MMDVNRINNVFGHVEYLKDEPFVSTTDNISSILDKIVEEHRKPDAREDQRSKLNISNGNVWAMYYENGFFKDKKIIIPEIKSVEVFYNKTVKITFKNGDIQTATVNSEDDFSLENGILYCLVKEMIGKEGTSIINKLISYATKIHYEALTKQANDLKAEKEAKELKDKKDRKFQKYLEKKRVKQRESRIEEMAEAIVRANQIEKRINKRKSLLEKVGVK